MFLDGDDCVWRANLRSETQGFGSVALYPGTRGSNPPLLRLRADLRDVGRNTQDLGAMIALRKSERCGLGVSGALSPPLAQPVARGSNLDGSSRCRCWQGGASHGPG